MKDYIGRCFVDCTKYIDTTNNRQPRIYFKNYKTAKRFAYYWTKRCGYFCRIFEYHLPAYFNDFKLGFDWVESWQNGKVVANLQYPYWERAKDQLSSIYGIRED